MVDMPYFMKKKEWYRFDYKNRQFVLTDKAPSDAQKSYKDYIKELTIQNEQNRERADNR